MDYREQSIHLLQYLLNNVVMLARNRLQHATFHPYDAILQRKPIPVHGAIWYLMSMAFNLRVGLSKLLHFHGINKKYYSYDVLLGTYDFTIETPPADVPNFDYTFDLGDPLAYVQKAKQAAFRQHVSLSTEGIKRILENLEYHKPRMHLNGVFYYPHEIHQKLLQVLQTIINMESKEYIQHGDEGYPDQQLMIRVCYTYAAVLSIPLDLFLYHKFTSEPITSSAQMYMNAGYERTKTKFKTLTLSHKKRRMRGWRR